MNTNNNNNNMSDNYSQYDKFVNDGEQEIIKEELKKENKKEQGTEEKDKLLKFRMVYPDAFGTIYLIPVESINKKPVTWLKGVREMKLPMEVKVETGEVINWWAKLLKKECYELTPGSKEDKLYDEISFLHKSFMREAKEKDDHAYNYVRVKNYSLIFGVILVHEKTDSSMVNIDKPGLVIIGNRGFESAYISSVKSKCKKLGSKNYQWMSQYYDRNSLNRKGLMSITVKKENQTTFINNVSHDKITEDHMGVTNGKTEFNLTEEGSMKFFTDHTRAFLGIKENDVLFNYDYFLTIKNKLIDFYNKKCAASPDTSNTPPQDVPSNTPPQNVPSNTPSQNVPSSTPSQNVPSNTPPQNVPSSTPPQNVPSNTPPQNESKPFNISFGDEQTSPYSNDKMDKKQDTTSLNTGSPF